MEAVLPFGKSELTAEIPDGTLMGVLRPGDPQRAEIDSALEHPIGTPLLSRIVRPGEKVAIVTSDITRPVPSHLILPPVVEELEAAGVADGDITVVFALGSHRKHTLEERRRLVGEALFRRVRCVDFEADRCAPVGVTTRGTPLEIFRPVAEADRRICVGNIEYHYFAGYSGGAKALLPGVASRASIQANHSLMTRPEAQAGRIEGNPVREDIEEALRFVPVDFIVNAVLDDHKRILRVFAGHPVEAHRAGCRYLDGINKAEIPRPADIVLASPGGYPKDINLYQAQKALDNAALAVRDGGIIILAAACGEGFGEETFARWMTEMTPRRMLESISREFVLGGHKAAAIAGILERARVFLVTDMPEEPLRHVPFTVFPTVGAALDEARKALGPDASVLVMPAAGATLPVPALI